MDLSDRPATAPMALGFGVDRGTLWKLALVLLQFAFQAQQLIEGY